MKEQFVVDSRRRCDTVTEELLIITKYAYSKILYAYLAKGCKTNGKKQDKQLLFSNIILLFLFQLEVFKVLLSVLL